MKLILSELHKIITILELNNCDAQANSLNDVFMKIAKNLEYPEDWNDPRNWMLLRDPKFRMTPQVIEAALASGKTKQGMLIAWVEDHLYEIDAACAETILKHKHVRRMMQRETIKYLENLVYGNILETPSFEDVLGK